MTQLTEIFESVVDWVNSLGHAAVVGAMPPHNGIAMQISTGATDTTFLDKTLVVGLSIIINGKNESQSTALDELNEIHQSLVMTKDYPSGDGWQIVDIRTDSFPNYIGREDSQFLYGSAIRVRAHVFNRTPITPNHTPITPINL